MTRQTTPELASTVQAYSHSAGDLLAELSGATAQDKKSAEVTLRLVQAFGRFQMDAEQAMRIKLRTR